MKAATTLADLKNVNWSNGESSLWAIFFEGRGEDAPITVRQIRTTDRLRIRLREILVGQAKRAQAVRPYAYETSDLDEDEALVVSDDRDLLKTIVRKLDAARVASVTCAEAPVSSIEEILSAAGYVIRLEANSGDIVHGFKKMPETIGTKKRLFDVVFEQLELDEEQKVERFRLSRVVDAFHFKETSFVLSKKDFEAGLRYREAMRTSALAAVEMIKRAKVLANAPRLLESENYHLLRRLAGIGKDPRFNDPNWLVRVRQLNDKHDWKLKFSEDGMLLLDAECLNLVLTLLRDRRALTLIFGEMIDADVARPVQHTAAS